MNEKDGENQKHNKTKSVCTIGPLCLSYSESVKLTDFSNNRFRI